MLVDRYGDILEVSKLDADGSRMVIKRTQDVQPYFDANAKERSSDTGGWKGDLHKVASIPLVVFEAMCKEAGCNLLAPEHRQTLISMLNNRDYLRLRTKEGRL